MSAFQLLAHLFLHIFATEYNRFISGLKAGIAARDNQIIIAPDQHNQHVFRQVQINDLFACCG